LLSGLLTQVVLLSSSSDFAVENVEIISVVIKNRIFRCVFIFFNPFEFAMHLISKVLLYINKILKSSEENDLEEIDTERNGDKILELLKYNGLKSGGN